jgi:hypothetical protein
MLSKTDCILFQYYEFKEQFNPLQRNGNRSDTGKGSN